MADRVPTRKVPWRLTQEAFDALLARLDADRSRAAERYELLRRKLVRVFEWRGAIAAEDLADETFNRISRRLAQGEDVRDVSSYAAGVARMVWREVLKDREQSNVVVDELSAPVVEDDDDETALRRDCLDRCLESLPGDQRDLILEYFTDDRREKIDHRRRIASRLGIELNALRIRVHRIRTRLEQCVRQCVEGKQDR